jgi:bifunctional non-homologous end joining protein LigD
MLATAVTALPRGPGWAFEFKWDGVRALLDSRNGEVRLYSRNGARVDAAYPELVSQGATLGDALLDGEIVAFVDGRPSFDALQSRMHVRDSSAARQLATQVPVTFMAFDVLRIDGADLTARPYRERRAALERLAADGWTISPSFDDGAATAATAREHHLEGVVAKRLDSPYRAGARSGDWSKLRFARSGDFAVVGWEAPAERPNDLSSLVLAYRTPRKDLAGRDAGVQEWHFAGKVGSGLSGATARSLHSTLTSRPECVLSPPPPRSPGRVVTWVETTVVVEVEFATWTDEGRLRHPVFRRIRTDKTVAEAHGDA